MKPHEETWEWDEGAGSVRLATDRLDVLPGGAHGACDWDPARARLAAQAPAMARLLCTMSNKDGDGACVCCHEVSCDDPSCNDFPASHAPDCELVAVLRAAGVVE